MVEEFRKSNSVSCLEQETITVNFACQRCCQPLRIHKSFSTIDRTGDDEDEDEETKGEFEMYKQFPYLVESGLNMNDFLLVDGVGANSRATNFSSSNTSPTGQLTTNATTMSRGVKGSHVKPPVDDLNYNLRVTSRLFDVLSDQSNVNHPLCEECADFIIDQMDSQLKVLEDECKVYREFLENLDKQKASDKTEETVEELSSKLQTLKTTENKLIDDLEHTIAEKQKLEKEIEEQNMEVAKLNQDENRFWNEYNYMKKKMFDCEDELQSLDNQLKYAETHLEKIKNTNIFAATFHIWHDGHFGTINGLRLGRLPTFNIEWSEINAAWGQVVLLLHSLAKKISLTFKRYKLVPYGNHSFIQSLEEKSRELPLFGSGGYRFMWDTKYDQAMVAFLDCLQQFQEEIEKENSDFCLPYRIKNGKIEDQTKHLYSIKICRNSEEEWTKALKFMLTDLKWIITWVTMHSALK